MKEITQLDARRLLKTASEVAGALRAQGIHIHARVRDADTGKPVPDLKTIYQELEEAVMRIRSKEKA